MWLLLEAVSIPSNKPTCSKLKLAVILTVMRKRLMCSSCILWPALCSAICLCQLPLSPPTPNIILKSTGSPSLTADRQAFCRHTWCEVPTPTLAHPAPPQPALLVKPSLIPIPCSKCGMTLETAAGWTNLLPLHHGHAWGPKATSALTIGGGAEPAEHIHATGRQHHSAGQSSSSSLLSLSVAPPLCSSMISY